MTWLPAEWSSDVVAAEMPPDESSGLFDLVWEVYQPKLDQAGKDGDRKTFQRIADMEWRYKKVAYRPRKAEKTLQKKIDGILRQDFKRHHQAPVRHFAVMKHYDRLLSGSEKPKHLLAVADFYQHALKEAKANPDPYHFESVRRMILEENGVTSPPLSKTKKIWQSAAARGLKSLHRQASLWGIGIGVSGATLLIGPWTPYPLIAFVASLSLVLLCYCMFTFMTGVYGRFEALGREIDSLRQ